MSIREEIVPGDRAVWQSDQARVYRCPTCERPIFSQNESDAAPAIECRPDRSHRLTWKTYTCEHCGGTFDKEDDSEANAEAKELFGVEDASDRDDMSIVCDDCFKAMAAHFGWPTTP